MIVKHKRYDIIMAIEAEMFRLLFCAIKGGLQWSILLWYRKGRNSVIIVIESEVWYLIRNQKIGIWRRRLIVWKSWSLLIRYANDGKRYLYDIIDIKKETSNSLGEWSLTRQKTHFFYEIDNTVWREKCQSEYSK